MSHFLLPESVSCEWTLTPPISWSDSTSRHTPKLHALVYEITPPTTAIIDYATGLEKLSANGYLFNHIAITPQVSKNCQLTDIFSVI